jgi:DNA polymerase delta subunit OB-fold domain
MVDLDRILSVGFLFPAAFLWPFIPQYLLICRLATSSEENGVENGQIERTQLPYAGKYQRFVLPAKGRSYAHQYSHIYNKRLSQMRDMVKIAAKKKWTDTGKWRECSKVIDLRPDENSASVEWVVVGCIYKDQPLKPSILDEYG